MKKLSKEKLAERDAITAKLKEKNQGLLIAIAEFNRHLEEKYRQVEEACNQFNEAVVEANEWQEAVQSDIESFMKDKSDRWHEGEIGEAYQSWHDEFEPIDEIEFEMPELFDDPDDITETLNERPEAFDES
jgi:hypothetical protein